MYYVVGSTMNLFFEDELANLSTIQKNIVCGSITGGIFKSTLGKLKINKLSFYRSCSLYGRSFGRWNLNRSTDFTCQLNESKRICSF